MNRHPSVLLGFLAAPSLALGCGLDWTLPTNHFDGVDEHGYVSYWEKIGEADLGDGLVIPVNINFNSHREASSPYLGKGWMVALLESHVEPIDENTMKVIMPDGWNFYFYRNDNTQTWRGNAGWVGETNNTLFTITAPCGWKIKFDAGKIQEIDSNKGRTLTYKYNGPVAIEVDVEGKAFVNVDANLEGRSTEDIIIGNEKIDVTLAQRPRLFVKAGQSLIVGFDESLNRLQRSGADLETFAFGTSKELLPTLSISVADKSPRILMWDAATKKIKSDGDWSYVIGADDQAPSFSRKDGLKQEESWSRPFPGETDEKYLNGYKSVVKYFAGGPLMGKMREIDSITPSGISTVLYRAKYDENGRVMREEMPEETVEYRYSPTGKMVDVYSKGVLITHREYDEDGLLTKYSNPKTGNDVQTIVEEISHRLAATHVTN